MPALPPASKVLRVDYKGTIGSDPNWQWRSFWRYSGTLSQADCNTLASNFFSAWAATGAYISTTNQDTKLITCEVTDLTSNTAPQAIQTSSATGGNTAPPLSAGAAVVISWKIARRYRGGHPRIYLPGHNQTDLATPQTWSSAAIAAFQTATLTWLAQMTTSIPVAVGTLNQVNVSYFEGFTNVTFPSGRTRPVPKLRLGGPVVDIVTGFSVNPFVATQRRRNQTP